MWRHKTELELRESAALKKRQESRFNPTIPLFCTVLVLLFWLVGNLKGMRGRSYAPPVSFPAALALIPRHFVMTFPLVYAISILSMGTPGNRRKSQPPVVICNRCYTVQAQTADDHCPCGGQFELFELWTWVKDTPADT